MRSESGNHVQAGNRDVLSGGEIFFEHLGFLDFYWRSRFGKRSPRFPRLSLGVAKSIKQFCRVFLTALEPRSVQSPGAQNPHSIRPATPSVFPRNNGCAVHSSAHAPTAHAPSSRSIERPSTPNRARTSPTGECTKVERDGRSMRLRVSREMRRAQNFRHRIGEIRQVRFREAGRAGARDRASGATHGRDHRGGGHTPPDAR